MKERIFVLRTELGVAKSGEIAKKSYQAPKLIRLGSVKELTHGNQGSSADGNCSESQLPDSNACPGGTAG